MGMRHWVKVCGRRRCREIQALISTGVRETAISRKVARSLGIKETPNPVATMTLIPESGCRRSRQPVVIDDELSRRWGNATGLVIGWGYLRDREAQVTASLGEGDRILCGRHRKPMPRGTRYPEAEGDVRMRASTARMPAGLRPTKARWSVPARTHSQRAVRNAQFAAQAAEDGECDIAKVAVGQIDEELDLARKAGRIAASARRAAEDAKRYIARTCRR